MIKDKEIRKLAFRIKPNIQKYLDDKSKASSFFILNDDKYDTDNFHESDTNRLD